jgi:hypothetical protein
MKNIFLSISIAFMALLFLVGCGDSSRASLEESQDTSIKISIIKAQNTTGFNKQRLEIKHMQVEVYTALNAVDESYSNKIPIQIGNFSRLASEWTVNLSGLEKSKYYIFVVTAFSSETVDISKLIFKGIKNHEIVEGINEIAINLTQTANANTIQNLPTVSSMLVTTLANSSIELSFDISNPYEEALTWEIRNDGVSTTTEDFSSNSGSTSTLNTAIKLNYLETTSNSYLLLLSTEDAVVSYYFSININDNGVEVEISVETAPVITQLIVSVVGNQLSLTPELDKVANTYAWEIVENLGSTISIDNPSAQSITLSPYVETSEFKIKLTVTSANGAFSYRIYHVFGNYGSDVTDVVIPPITVDNGNIKKTQQTKSYDYLGDEDANVKDDGHYKNGITPSYTKNPTTKIVTDNVTSLMWQDDNDTTLDWAHADKYCTDSPVGSFTDWRLPSPSELDTLKTYYPLDPVSATHTVLLDPIFEERTTFKYSSSLKTGERAWTINFKMGNIGDVKSFRVYPYRVRCVRGTFSKPTFTKDIITGIVTDSLNNLEWQDNGAFVAEPWKDAMDRCENLTLGEVGNDKGWRLPNVNELNSIVNRNNNPRMDSTFTSQPSFGNSYWSSTAYFNSKAFAYIVEVATGSSGTVNHNIKTSASSSIYSRCVRDVALSGE